MAQHCTNSEFRRTYKDLKALKRKSQRLKKYIKNTKRFAVSVILWLLFTFGSTIVIRRYKQRFEEQE